MTSSSSRSVWSALAAVNLAAVLFGTTALFGKLAVSPVWLVAGRAVFAVLALSALAGLIRRPIALPRSQRGAVAVSGGLLALHWITFFVSVRWAGVAIATLTFATFPLLIIMIEAVRHRRRPSLVELSAGVAVVAAVGLIAIGADPEGPRPAAGLVVGLASSAAFAIFTVVSQVAGRHVDGLSLSLSQNLVVAVLMAPMLAATAPPHGGGDWVGLAALGVFGTALSHQLYLFAMTRLPAAVCGALVSLEPVYAIAFAALLFGEALGSAVFASAALIVGASVVLLRKGDAPPG